MVEVERETVQANTTGAGFSVDRRSMSLDQYLGLCVRSDESPWLIWAVPLLVERLIPAGCHWKNQICSSIWSSY